MDRTRPNRIAELRLQQKLSQAELAERVGTHPVTLSKLERGKMRLDTGWMMRIANALNVDEIDLISDTPYTRTLYVLGSIKDNGRVDEFEDGDAIPFDIDIGLSTDEDARWYVVENGILFGVFDSGTMLRFNKTNDHDANFDKIVMIESAEEGRYIGRLMKGTDNKFYILQLHSGKLHVVYYDHNLFFLSMAICKPQLVIGADGLPVP